MHERVFIILRFQDSLRLHFYFINASMWIHRLEVIDFIISAESQKLI